MLESMNPTTRFTGLAETYSRHRPGYPEAAVQHILTRCQLRSGAEVLDVGSGTGIFARQLAAHGVHVLGLEPNDDMRQQAERDTPAGTALAYCAGRAEDTGLAAQSVAAVVSAQAFHWFAPDAALREFARVLRPGGWVALLWYERDERDPFTAAYGDLLRTLPGAVGLERARARAGEALLEHPLYELPERSVFAHAQALDEEGLIGRAMSVSYAQREPEAVRVFAEQLRKLYRCFASGLQVVMQYETTVFSARLRQGEWRF